MIPRLLAAMRCAVFGHRFGPEKTLTCRGFVVRECACGVVEIVRQEPT